MTILGQTIEGEQLIRLDSDARARGIYVIGSTGTGKTTLLQSLAYQDIRAGDGVCVLDPHGDMIDWLLERIPSEREQDVVFFNPAEEDRPFGLNLLACERDDPKQVRWVVSTIMATIRRLYEWSWGPRLEHVLGHTLWTAMAIQDSTLIEVLLLLTDEDYRNPKIKQLKTPLLKNFWKMFPERQREQLEFISSTVNKLTPFLLDKSMQNIVGQTENSFDLRELMDKKKILLVNLSKGDLGENNASLLGSVIINLILMAALSRRDMHPDERKELPFHVIVDEYQNFAGDSFSVLQSEARKYAVDLVVAHQFRDQLTVENRGSALNVGNFICFRTTGVDGPELAGQFDNTPPEPDKILEPVSHQSQLNEHIWKKSKSDFVKVDGPQRLYSDVMMQKANDLTNLAPFHFDARIIEPHPNYPRRLQLAEYALTTVDPEQAEASLISTVYGVPDPERAARIRQQSYKEYGKLRAEVEVEIAARTGGHADMENPPWMKMVAGSELVDQNEPDSLLTSEIDQFKIRK